MNNQKALEICDNLKMIVGKAKKMELDRVLSINNIPVENLEVVIESLVFQGQAADKLAEYEELEKRGFLLRLPCETVWFIVDQNTKHATVMPRSIRDLRVYEIEEIDKDGKYYSRKEDAESKLQTE